MQIQLLLHILTHIYSNIIAIAETHTFTQMEWLTTQLTSSMRLPQRRSHGGHKTAQEQQTLGYHSVYLIVVLERMCCSAQNLQHNAAYFYKNSHFSCLGKCTIT